MKARTPFTVRQTSKDWRQWIIWTQILLCCWTLHTHFGFGKERLLRFIQFHGDDAESVAQMKHNYATNKTWQDELWYWGEAMGLNDALKGEK